VEPPTTRTAPRRTWRALRHAPPAPQSRPTRSRRDRRCREPGWPPDPMTRHRQRTHRSIPPSSLTTSTTADPTQQLQLQRARARVSSRIGALAPPITRDARTHRGRADSAQPTTPNLLRRPRRLELVLYNTRAAADTERVGSLGLQLPTLGTPITRQRPILRPAAVRVTSQDRRAEPFNLCAMTQIDRPADRPREISSRSANDNRSDTFPEHSDASHLSSR